MESINDILDAYDKEKDVSTGDLENVSKNNKPAKNKKKKKSKKSKPKDDVIGVIMKLVAVVVMLVGVGLLLYRGVAILQDGSIKNTTRDIVKMHEKEKKENPKTPTLVEKLQAEFGNKGIVGYISFPEAGIDYPVLHAENNEHYLDHDPYNKSSINGSIYLDCDNKDDFTDFANVIYGHHMANGSMFGSLVKLTQGNIEGKQFTLYSQHKKYIYKVIAYEAVDPNDREFFLGRWTKGRKQFSEGLASRASQYIGTGKEKQYVTLITCHYTNLGTVRYGITGGLVSVEDSE